MEVLVVLVLLLLLVAVALLLVLLRRPPAPTPPELLAKLDSLERAQERTERGLRDEVGRHREETQRQSLGDREAQERQAALGRQEQAKAFQQIAEGLRTTLAELARLQQQRLEAFAQQLGRLSEAHEQRAESLRLTVDQRLQQLAAENGAKLEQMRATVDEKLQGTLEKRLGESFAQVSERLEQVHKGLGEMQVLASGVGDLKRVLTNVKSRGSWGEVQLEALLGELLAPEQYERNVATRPGSQERVEFAVRLPGHQSGEAPVWLPIDAKFPTEDWQRLQDAHDRADVAGTEAAGKALEARVRQCAKDVHDKYLHPPQTTDFGLLFLPVEGLYAEVARRPALLEQLQREQRVVIAGPTTLAALLNSLQMGFRTLAIQKRSGEVWQLLGAVKTEFGKFGTVLDGVKKKLDQASGQIDEAAVRTRAIERRLRGVQELPAAQAVVELAQDADAD